MAARRVRRRGRTTVALVLVAIVVVASTVVWRRSVGTSEARVVDQLRSQRAALEARKASLERDVRELGSRTVIAPVAERSLGLHVAHDAEQVILERPAATHRSSRSSSAPED
jgi:outer membrane murein-binding lipoprotein Lpp